MQSASVLVVDDDPIVRLDLRALITQLGHRVIGEAESGAQALTLTRTLRPDVVLLDVLLPSLSGLEVARTLTTERLAAVLLFTGATDDDTIAQLETCGAMGFLSKPLRPTDLRAAIPIAVSRFRERIALEEEVQNLSERMEARKLVGRAKAILMERHGLSEREAFRRIQGQGQLLNKPVHEIARAIITASELAVESITRDPVTGGGESGLLPVPPRELPALRHPVRKEE